MCFLCTQMCQSDEIVCTNTYTQKCQAWTGQKRQNLLHNSDCTSTLPGAILVKHFYLAYISSDPCLYHKQCEQCPYHTQQCAIVCHLTRRNNLHVLQHLQKLQDLQAVQAAARLTKEPGRVALGRLPAKPKVDQSHSAKAAR